jgi:hypothetical protein
LWLIEKKKNLMQKIEKEQNTEYRNKKRSDAKKARELKKKDAKDA